MGINLIDDRRVFNTSNNVHRATTAATDRDIDIEDTLKPHSPCPGVKFADMDLIGIPHRLVISDRGLKENQIEYQERRSQERQDLAADEAVAFIKETLSA